MTLMRQCFPFPRNETKDDAKITENTSAERHCYIYLQFTLSLSLSPLLQWPALLRPPSLNSAVRTDGFNSLEWPLYGVLSILILLTIAILRLHPCSATTFRALIRDPPLEATWLAFKPPHSRARSFRDSSSHLLSFSDLPTFPVRFNLPLAFFIDHARISLAVPSISLRIHRIGYPARERERVRNDPLWRAESMAVLPNWKIRTLASENYVATKYNNNW